jgi:hypothetical protein
LSRTVRGDGVTLAFRDNSWGGEGGASGMDRVWSEVWAELSRVLHVVETSPLTPRIAVVAALLVVVGGSVWVAWRCGRYVREIRQLVKFGGTQAQAYKQFPNVPRKLVDAVIPPKLHPGSRIAKLEEHVGKLKAFKRNRVSWVSWRLAGVLVLGLFVPMAALVLLLWCFPWLVPGAHPLIHRVGCGAVVAQPTVIDLFWFATNQAAVGLLDRGVILNESLPLRGLSFEPSSSALSVLVAAFRYGVGGFLVVMGSLVLTALDVWLSPIPQLRERQMQLDEARRQEGGA